MTFPIPKRISHILPAAVRIAYGTAIAPPPPFSLALSSSPLHLRHALTALALLALSGFASPDLSYAQQVANPGSTVAPSSVLTLEANASAEVPADIVRIDMFYEAEGNDPGALAKRLNERTDAALKLAKAQDVVKVKTGAFSIAPSTDRDGKISTWRGRSELELESRDFAAASKLAGALSDGLQVSGVSFSLSPEAQQRAETTLRKQAIASFQQQALEAAQAFGYTGFTVREVNVGQNGMQRQPRILMRAMVASPASAKVDAIPIEAGTSTVTVTVNGAVQMTR